jgi:hypothetical protein
MSCAKGRNASVGHYKRSLHFPGCQVDLASFNPDEAVMKVGVGT